MLLSLQVKQRYLEVGRRMKEFEDRKYEQWKETTEQVLPLLMKKSLLTKVPHHTPLAPRCLGPGLRGRQIPLAGGLGTRQPPHPWDSSVALCLNFPHVEGVGSVEASLNPPTIVLLHLRRPWLSGRLRPLVSESQAHHGSPGQ